MTRRAYKFSLIINNYNYAKYVGEAIESALNQNDCNVEVIVVDDGSSDDSRDIIKKYENIFAVYQENKGQCAAFRAGLKVATGDIVIQIDSDDLLMPNTCSKIESLWSDEVVYAQYRLIAFSEKGGDIGLIPRAPFTREHVQHLIQKGRFPYSPTTGNAYSTEVVKQVMDIVDPPDRFSPDGLLITCVPLAGKSITMNEPLGRYRIHDKNFSWGVSLEFSHHTANVIRDGAFRYAEAIGRSLPSNAIISQRSAFATSLKLFALGSPLVDEKECRHAAWSALRAGLRDNSAEPIVRLKLIFSGALFWVSPHLASRLTKKRTRWRNTPDDNILIK